VRNVAPGSDPGDPFLQGRVSRIGNTVLDGDVQMTMPLFRIRAHNREG
jgi:hypothetical protein